MKKILAVLLSTVMTAGLLAGCGNDSGGSSSGAFKPSKNIDWIVTSSPGGGSDIYTRMITDIMKEEKLVTNTFLVNNKTDGGGEVGRSTVANTAKAQADHTLLTFNSGDLMPMVKNTPNRLENFTPIAIMAVDKQLLFKGKDCKYDTFEDAIKAAESGTPIIIGGSKGDDIATYEKLIDELGMDTKQMTYITSDSTGDAITSILGGHVDFVIAKPAAASEYVEAKKLTPVLALAEERFGGALKDAPTLSEIGDYDNVEVPVWRGVVGPKNMSPEAAKFWSEQLKKVSESSKWKEDYLEKNMLIPQYMDLEETEKYMSDYQKDYMKTEGIKK